jgi:hypothetical protein
LRQDFPFLNRALHRRGALENHPEKVRNLNLDSRCEVANRPSRLEPSALKRRRDVYPLLEEFRDTLRARPFGGRNDNDWPN